MKGTLYALTRTKEDIDEKQRFKLMLTEVSETGAVVIDGANIAADSIYTRHLRADSVIAEHIKAGEITTDHILAGSINADRLMAHTITSTMIHTEGLSANVIKTGKIIAGNNVSIIDMSNGEFSLAGGKLGYVASTNKLYIGAGALFLGELPIEEHNRMVGSRQSAETQKTAITNEKQALDARYTSLYGNVSLTGTPKTDLATKYSNATTGYTTRYNSLVAALNAVIAAPTNTTITAFATLQTAVTTATSNYTTAVFALNTALELATKTIENAVAAKAQADATAAAALDATTKAATAETNAKTHADTQVSNVEVGGRNLILGSAQLSTSGLGSAAGSSAEYKTITVGQSYMDVAAGTVVTISFDMEMTVGTANPTMQIYNSNVKGPKTFSTKIVSFVAAAGSTIRQRVNVTTTISDVASPTVTYNTIEFYTVYGTSNWFKIANLKLERGNKATDWTPAPEDVTAQIETKSKTFTSTPTNYAIGDIWKDSATVKIATTASAAYNAAHWTLVGDVTGANTANDVSYVNGTSASTIKTQAAAGNTAQTTLVSKAPTWDTASVDASAAKVAIADMSSDGKVTPIEKVQLKKEWATIAAERTSLDGMAATFGITTERTSMTNAYNALNAVLNTSTGTTNSVTNGILINMTTTTTLVGSNFRAIFDDYYDKKAVLQRKSSEVARQRAIDAETNAITTASSDATAKANASEAAATFYANRKVIENNSHLEFNGTNSYAKITNNLVSAPTGLTISAWFKKTGATDYACVIHSASTNSVGSSSYWLGVSSTNKLTATIGANVGVGWQAGETNINAELGVWYHLAAAWDGSVVRVYINGVLSKQYALASYISQAAPTRFGASSDGANYRLQGAIGEVAIWSRALSGAEIADAVGRTISATNLVGYWDMNEGTGDTINDSTGANNGTAYNTQWRGIISKSAELAKAYADAVAVAKAGLATAEANAYADGIVSAEETARIAEASAKLTEAKNYAIAQILADNTIKDTRSTNELPNYYFSTYPSQLVREFKYSATMGVATGDGTYGILTTNVPWTGSSGGSVKQEFRVGDKTYKRSGSSTSWTSWVSYDDIATTAASNATTANNLLSDMASDSKLTAIEKQDTLKEWNIITGEYSGILAEATRLSVASATYTAAYNTLNGYIPGLVSNVTTTSDIVGTTFRTNFKNYYDARQVVLNSITASAEASAKSYAELVGKILSVNGATDSYFNFDKNLTASNGTAPLAGYTAAIIPDGKFGKGVSNIGQKLYYDKAIMPLSAFTISGWFKPILIHTAQAGNSGIGSGYWFPLIELATPTTGTCVFSLSTEPDVSPTYNRRLKLQGTVTGGGTTSLSNGTWYQVSATFDGSRYKVYLNGEIEINVASTTILTPTADSVFMAGGGYLGRSNVIFDELFVSSRVFSQDELRTIYVLNQPFYDNNPIVLASNPQGVTISIT